MNRLHHPRRGSVSGTPETFWHRRNRGVPAPSCRVYRPPKRRIRNDRSPLRSGSAQSIVRCCRVMTDGLVWLVHSREPGPEFEASLPLPGCPVPTPCRHWAATPYYRAGIQRGRAAGMPTVRAR